MSESKHTPGPRKAYQGGDKLEWERPGCGFVLGPDNETVVGRFPRYADAILDAAAPDLLEALTAAVASVKINDAGEPIKGAVPWSLEWFADARAAIAKATGCADARS